MTDNTDTFGEKLHFEVGDIIYDQDSESTGVYLLLEGRVDIWHYQGDDASHIATISQGDLLGEVSVIEDRPHSVTAKASTPTTALFIAATAFRRSFSDPLVRHVVTTLASRLRSSYTEQKSAPAPGHTPKASITKNTGPTLEGSSRIVADKLLTFVEIKEFPFLVGNIASTSKHSLVTINSLRIPLKGVPELADNHFEIIRRDSHLYVRDLGSPHGTLVNGEALSKYGITATAKLHDGKNEIVAGKTDSPVRFTLNIPAAYRA
ncbi:cyclic nucleotide-binding domain-containing protein [Kordiimonas pumila]|uniref:Cyclic nucleotide-binding domain-containing protein n=1 Tax=Kordiimonas pumila TaxID=2161677 RepID=A0ABV7D183_9PROT|nr:cyclic nucleotide-binding domain-containing protein [Kordiimonas pumila]